MRQLSVRKNEAILKVSEEGFVVYYSLSKMSIIINTVHREIQSVASDGDKAAYLIYCEP